VRLALGLALVASLAYGAEPGEVTAKAYRLDAPFQVVQDGKVLAELDGGVVMPQASFDDVDQEFVRLQRLEQVHMGEPSPWGWMLAGGIVGAITSAVLLIGFYFVTR
jgi:hypothetical protein